MIPGDVDANTFFLGTPNTRGFIFKVVPYPVSYQTGTPPAASNSGSMPGAWNVQFMYQQYGSMYVNGIEDPTTVFFPASAATGVRRNIDTSQTSYPQSTDIAGP